MRHTEDMKSISYMKTNSAQLVQEVNKKRRAVVITQNGEAKAVLMDMKSYEEQKNALLFLQLVALGEKEIKNRRVVSQDVVFSKLKEKFAL